MKVVFVHAHPDDEVITTSLTIAKFIKEGHDVTVLNFLKGDAGLSFLDQYPEGTQDFVNKRLLEHENAMKALGVTKHTILTNHKDSKPNIKLRASDCFINQDIQQFVDMLYNILNEIKPDLVITYDELGYSGHPDHIRTQEIAMLAIKQLEDFGYRVPEVWWTALPWKINPFLPKDPFDRVFTKQYKMSDIDIIVDGEEFIDQKILALRCYETQMITTVTPYTNSQGDWVGYWVMVGNEEFRVPLFTKEYYVIGKR